MTRKVFGHVRTVFALALLPLAGCAGGAQLGVSALSNPSGTAASLFGIPAATVSTQVGAELDQIIILATKFQMLKAQLDGTPIMLPPLPVVPSGVAPPVSIPMTPVVVPGGTLTPGTLPTGPTPNG